MLEKMKDFAIIVLLLIFSSTLNAQSIPIDSIPFELKNDNRIYLNCKINDSDSLLFLFDTGATDLVINSERLSKVKMDFNSTVENRGTTGISIIKSSTHNKFTFGKQVVKDLQIISIPYPNEKWDGVLGLSVLKNFVVSIDYSTKKIYLFDKESYKNSSKNKLKIDYVFGVPTIDVSISTIEKKQRKLKLELDTGSDRIIDISTNYVNKNNLRDIYKSPFARSTITSSDGNSGYVDNVYFTIVKIANFEFYKIPGGLGQIKFGILSSNEMDGMIGNSFLKRFNLIFDFKNNYVFFEPNDNLHTPYYDFLIK